MRPALLTALILTGISILPGCGTSRVRTSGNPGLGMSKAEVKERFGEPLRIERRAGGSESWFYNVAVTEEKTRIETSAGYTPPELVTGYGYTDGGETRTASKVMETVTTTAAAAVDFGALGTVEAIPNGRIQPGRR